MKYYEISKSKSYALEAMHFTGVTVQIHYGMLDQHVGTTNWTKMLYKLVGPTFHSEFAPLNIDNLYSVKTGKKVWFLLLNVKLGLVTSN